jgi:hypothetical protein
MRLVAQLFCRVAVASPQLLSGCFLAPEKTGFSTSPDSRFAQHPAALEMTMVGMRSLLIVVGMGLSLTVVGMGLL